MQSVVEDARTDEGGVDMGRLWPVLVYDTRPNDLPRAVVLLDGQGGHASIVAVFRRGELLLLDQEPEK